MNDFPVERFRTNYPSLVTALVLEIFILGPGLFLSPGLFIKEIDLAVPIGFGLVGLVVLLTIIRYVLLQVEIGPYFIVKKGILGTQRIDLSPDCRFRYNIAQFGSTPKSEYSNNYTIILRNRTTTMRLTSSVRGMNKVAQLCHEYEASFIFPEMQKQIAQGSWIDSGPIRQNAETVVVGRNKLSKPLQFKPEVEDGILVLFKSESFFGKIKIHAKTIWNPHATFALLSNLSPEQELSIEEPQRVIL